MKNRARQMAICPGVRKRSGLVAAFAGLINSPDSGFVAVVRESEMKVAIRRSGCECFSREGVDTLEKG
jgi:hypothetical protein